MVKNMMYMSLKPDKHEAKIRHYPLMQEHKIRKAHNHPPHHLVSLPPMIIIFHAMM